VNFTLKQCVRIGLLALLFWQADLARVCLQTSSVIQSFALASNSMNTHRFVNIHDHNTRTPVQGHTATNGHSVSTTGYGGKRRPGVMHPNTIHSPKNNVIKVQHPQNHPGRIHIKSEHFKNAIHGIARRNIAHKIKPIDTNNKFLIEGSHEQYTDVLTSNHHADAANTELTQNEISGNEKQTHPPSFTIPTQHETAVVLAVNPEKITLKNAKNSGLKVKQTLSFPNLGITVTSFEVPAGNNAASALGHLQQKGTARVILNHYYRLDSVSKQTDETVNSPEPPGKLALSGLSCNKGIRIGMVDSYVNTSILPLVGQQIIRETFASGAEELNSDHGTAIAELLVGHHNEQFRGLLPDAMLFAAAAFSKTNTDVTQATVLSIIKSLDWLVSKKVQVINLSFSGPNNDLLALAIQKILEKGIPVVAAAGNHGQNGPPAYPGAYGGVIAVTAIDKFHRPYRKANQGEYISFSAPGVRVPVPCSNRKMCYKSGTSFAAPYYTAMIATRLFSGNKTKHIKKIISSLKREAVDLGAPGKDPIFGWGLVPFNQESFYKTR
jgi:hypothetical protein